MNAENAAKWREALLLPGETDSVESGVRELAEYFGVSRDEARRACENALADSKLEWESARRRTPNEIVDFYRCTRSYLFEHVWWHANDAETNAANVEVMNYALRRGAREYLDFGSGVGSNAILFAQHGFRVALADVSETMLRFAEWRLDRRGLKAELIDLNQQQLPRDRFDFVTAVDVCEHLVNPGAEFKRIARALKIGGAFVFNCRAGIDDERPMHILPTAGPVLRAIRRNSLREAADDATALGRLGFRVIERGAQSRIEDWVCGLYDHLRFNGLFISSDPSATNGVGHQPLHPQRIYLDRVKQRLDGSARWLDVGCGRQIVPWWMKERAEMESELKSRARWLVGVDPDLAALGDNRLCSARVNADAVRLPFADGSFDLVTANMVFEHVESPLASLMEIRRVLRNGGRLIVLTPNWLDIVTIAAWIAPNRWHPSLVSRVEERVAAEVYPTRFRFNRPATVEKILREAGFGSWRIESLEHPDVYGHTPVVARVEAAWHSLARRWPALRGTLLIEAEVA
jgi:ubiquinone/menaquinone biosynthesis C-methylase UbiE